MKLEAGKRYVLRNGRITGPLEEHKDRVYQFIEPDTGSSWKANGHCSETFYPHKADIVSEYVDEKPIKTIPHYAQISPEAQKQAMEFWREVFIYNYQTDDLYPKPTTIAEIADRCLDEFKKRFMQ